MSKISPLDLGEPLSPLPPDLSVHFAHTIDLTHKLAVRIACHMVRDRLPEAQAYHEVETCINLNGAKKSEEHAIQICIEGEQSTFQNQLGTQFGWKLTLIMDWSLEYWWAKTLLLEALQHPEGKVSAPQNIAGKHNSWATVPLPDASSGK